MATGKESEAGCNTAGEIPNCYGGGCGIPESEREYTVKRLQQHTRLFVDATNLLPQQGLSEINFHPEQFPGRELQPHRVADDRQPGRRLVVAIDENDASWVADAA
jgi:hypothetical protein